MTQEEALEVIALSQAVKVFGSTMDGQARYALEHRVRELTGLPDRGGRLAGPPTRPLPD